MNPFTGDISGLVLKRTVWANMGNVTFDNEMVQVLMELDGKKLLMQVAHSVNLNLKQLWTILTKLDNLGLCEVAEDATPKVDNVFLKYCQKNSPVLWGPSPV